MSSPLSSSRLVSGLPVAIATVFGCALSLAAERLLERRNRRRVFEELAERIYRCLQNLLDVKFVLGEKPNDRSEPDVSINLGQLTLCEDLAQRLTTAAELHSATVIKSCLEEVEQLGPSGSRLAQHLRQFLASYDMKTIQRLVAQIPVQSETERETSSAL